MSELWLPVRLSSEARADLAGIGRWTKTMFGPAQARSYELLIARSIASAAANPMTPLSRDQSLIEEGLRSIRVARRGKPSRHIVFYRVGSDGRIEIVRVLHESMDLLRQLNDS